MSPCSLFLKREVCTRFDLLRQDGKSRVLEKQSQQKTDHDRHAQSRQFSIGQSVMVKNLRPGPNWLPAVVVERLGSLSYLVETTDQQVWRRHIDHIKERVNREDTQLPPDTNVRVWEPPEVDPFEFEEPPELEEPFGVEPLGLRPSGVEQPGGTRPEVDPVRESDDCTTGDPGTPPPLVSMVPEQPAVAPEVVDAGPSCSKSY